MLARDHEGVCCACGRPSTAISELQANDGESCARIFRQDRSDRWFQAERRRHMAAQSRRPTTHKVCAYQEAPNTPVSRQCSGKDVKVTHGKVGEGKIRHTRRSSTMQRSANSRSIAIPYRYDSNMGRSSAAADSRRWYLLERLRAPEDCAAAQPQCREKIARRGSTHSAVPSRAEGREFRRRSVSARCRSLAGQKRRTR